MNVFFQLNEDSGNNLTVPQVQLDSRTLYHFERQRLNRLFTEAVRYPLVIVCAGAGYGKTSAVHDFVEEYKAPTAWMQISERDNIPERFWENYTHAMNQFDVPFAKAISKIGFPDTPDRQNQYLVLSRKFMSSLGKRIFVVDDIHMIENPVILRFAERIIGNQAIGTTTITISRTTPSLNTVEMISKGQAFIMSENDLRFTEKETAQYFHGLDILPQPENLREIMQDTGGWAFAINLIARSYQKAPGYGGYLRSAMKMNIFQVMEIEIWNEISDRIRTFLTCISLIDHLSFDLIKLLAGEDEELITEMERQNAYIRRDSYINAYLVHPLFLEFLAAKQDILSEEQKRETYKIAGKWCEINGFKIDALSYYEKIEDCDAIIAIFHSLPAQLPYDIAKFAVGMFDRAPAEAFFTVSSLAVVQVRCYMRLGLWQRSIELIKYYEAQFLKMPEDDVFRNRNLGGIYFLWGYLRYYMCLFDGIFDFDLYFKKFCEYHPKPDSLTANAFRSHVVGPWINANGSSKKGAPEEYIKAVSRAVAFLPHCFNGFMAGEDDLAWGELKFFQGDLNAAEAFLVQGMGKAREHRQFEIQHRALLYILRICTAQGNYLKAEQTFKEIKAQLDEVENVNRYINFEIAQAIYYYMLDQPDMIPDWIKQNISPYGHAAFIENYENQYKARYCYLTRNYPPLLAYFKEMRQRESYLYGRVVMLAMEACMHYKMKDKKRAYEVLSEAYEMASPNNLIMPFIELGKDMRTLTSAVLKEPDGRLITGGISKSWLENINRKAASYAKRHAQVVLAYRQANHIKEDIFLTPRETDILRDLSHGLSRAEIAAGHNLSINTVKMVINSIYSKLGAENIAELIRIAVERRMI